jgi:hypothetical protein
MFKTLVTRLAKEAWDNASKPAPEPKPAAAVAPVPKEPEPETDAGPAHVETDIQFPYYPGEGTACGSNCRCRWDVQVRWSAEHHSQATFATWVTADDESVCPDCRQRAHDWHAVMVRLEPSDQPG